MEVITRGTPKGIPKRIFLGLPEKFRKIVREIKRRISEVPAESILKGTIKKVQK